LGGMAEGVEEGDRNGEQRREGEGGLRGGKDSGAGRIRSSTQSGRGRGGSFPEIDEDSAVEGDEGPER
jgi:hypothetical protein